MKKEEKEMSGTIAWRSPSNIALIKYWGKRPIQIPENASISFTLNEAYSETFLSFKPRSNGEPKVTFRFEGSKEEAFAARIEKFLSSLQGEMPFIEDYTFEVESSNSFPHSSGIASSASSMSALSLCLCDMEQLILSNHLSKAQRLRRSSHIARLGSGSASRSVIPKLAVWGKSVHVPNSADEYAVAYNGVDSVFDSFHDDVLIVSKEKKSVSSSQGHALMDGNIYAKARYQQADQNMKLLLSSMKEGDLWTFGKIVEDEALSLHALMMCSDPSFILMKPNTLQVIESIRKFRKDTKVPIFFTLDAGPNVHILYPDAVIKKATEFIKTQLIQYAEEGRIIHDQVGNGPVKLM